MRFVFSDLDTNDGDAMDGIVVLVYASNVYLLFLADMACSLISQIMLKVDAVGMRSNIHDGSTCYVCHDAINVGDSNDSKV